jgi:pilus assembly protein Flp/PilA
MANGADKMLAKLYVRGMTWWSEWQTAARGEWGASAVEYGLLVALIAAIIAVVVALLGKKVSKGFSSIETGFP